MPTAIHPNFYQQIKSQIELDKDEPIEIKEEIAIADLSETAGWKLIKEYIESLQESLTLLVSKALESGATEEEIGKKTILSQLTKDYLNRIIEKVQDAKEAINTRRD